MKKYLSVIILMISLLTGCTRQSAPIGTEGTGSATAGTGPIADFSKTDTDLFTDRDGCTDYTEAGNTVILLNGDSAVCHSKSVSVSRTTVTITGDGTYILRGTLQDGTIIVDAEENHKPQLVLDGVSVTSAASAALYIRQADKVFLTLAEGSENYLANGGSFTGAEEANIDGTLFSRQDLTLNGSGSLTVTSPAGHGIVCKDDLAVTGGSYTVHAASHGVDVNDSMRLRAGNFTVDAGKDGIHSENSKDAALGYVYISGGNLDIEAEGDGISAGSHQQIMGGSIRILAGGGSENGESHNSGGWGDFMGGGPGGGMRPGGRAATEEADGSTSMKGLKAGTDLLIAGGTLTVDSADDAVHANGSITLSGGSLTLSSGDDGIHADSKLTVTDGTVEITESYEGLEALDILISGGKIRLTADDDGLNAAGGSDACGTEGGRDGMFGGWGGHGGMRPGMGGASNGSIRITGGKLLVKASGDGIDANGSIEISGGYTLVCGPNTGDTATLDYDTTASITGGTFIGTGASGMAQTFSGNTQGVLAIRAGTGFTAGQTVTVTDADGKELLRIQPELDFSVVIYSAPELVSGQSYHMTVGTLEGDITAY